MACGSNNDHELWKVVSYLLPTFTQQEEMIVYRYKPTCEMYGGESNREQSQIQIQILGTGKTLQFRCQALVGEAQNKKI